MFSSPALLVALTALFAITGLYSLVRLSRLASGAETGGDRVAELSHLLMSVAMLGMTWGRTGGPDTPGGAIQLVVFGLLSAWFLGHALRPHGHRRTGAAYHAIVQVAMVWMVVAMPALMGTGGSPGSGVHHHGGHETAATDAPIVATGAPPWVRLVTVAFAVVLGVAALAWANAALRPARVAVAPGARPAAPRSRPSRLDASCHVLMSLGMAGMLLAML